MLFSEENRFLIQQRINLDYITQTIINIQILFLIRKSQMKQQEQQLKLYKIAYSQLQHSFRNNLNVIKELQQENSELQKHLHQVQAKYESQLERALMQRQQSHRKQVQGQEMQFGRELQLVKREYEDLIGSINQKMEQKNQELIFKLTKKHWNEMQGLRVALGKELQARQAQIKKQTSRSKCLQQSVVSTESKLNASNVKILALQAQLQRISSQKRETQTLYSSYQQQLQTLKQSSNSWQDILKSRIKELQQQKSSLQEQMAEMRFSNKQKIKKLSQQQNKKISQLEQSHAIRLNQTLLQSREINFKFQAITNENIELKNVAESSKKQMQQAQRLLEEQKLKYASVQDSILTIKQKEFEIKSMTEEIKRLRSQLKIIVQQKDKLKQQGQKINYQRENAQKALQRLKVELINKTKQTEDHKKQLQKINYKTQLNTYQNQYQYQPSLKQTGTNQQLNNNKRMEKNQRKQNPKGQVDYSRCFTQDMGPIDQNFFMANSGSPTPQRLYIPSYDQIQQQKYQDQQRNQQKTTNTTHLMKRIGQLQVQNNQYRSTIKTLKQEMQRTSFLIQDKLSFKDKENRLSKDENLMLRQKLHDKEEQLMTLKDTVKSMKEDLIRNKQLQKQLNQIYPLKEQNQKLTQENKQLSEKIKQLKEEVQDLIKQRQTLEQIADDLRTEVNFYKDQINFYAERQSHLGRSSSLVEGKSGIIPNNSRTVSRYHQQHSSALQNDSINELSKNYSQNTQQNYQKLPSNDKQQPSKKPSANVPANRNNPRLSSQNPSNTVSYAQQDRKSKSKSRSPKQPKKQEPKPMKRKLHELIKQKNQLETENATIMGRKANIQKRMDQDRPQHVGTKSQRQIYDRLQRISKSRSKQKKTITLKDYEVPRHDMQVSVTKARFMMQQQQRSYQQPVNNSVSQVQQSKEYGNEDISETEMINRIGMINKMREEMANDSLGEFDHLENVSLTYWEQQV